MCDTLRAQLPSDRQVIGVDPQVRGIASAIASQNMQLRRLKNDMRRNGCESGSIVSYDRQTFAMCEDMRSTMLDMEDNMRAMEDQRDALIEEPRRRNADRIRILADLRDNGCFDDLPASRPLATDSENSFTPPVPRKQDLPSAGYGTSQGGLKTLCVRTCDGAFFPIASNASPLDFRGQAEQCARMCPGTETELYYHSMENGESADMISASSGKAYRALPSAFAYRNLPVGQNAQCSCDLPRYYRDMQRQNMTSASSPPPDAYSGVTDFKAKPETEAEADRTAVRVPDRPSVPAQAKAEPKPVPERPYDPQNSNIRRVGPQFLPNETSRIDLTRPAIDGPQPQQE